MALKKEIKKVLFVNHDADIGGASRSLVALIEGLTGRYSIVPFVLLPSTGPLVEVLEEKQIPYAIIEYSWIAVSMDYKLKNLKKYLIINYLWIKNYFFALRQLKNQLNNLDFDLIYSNTSVNAFGLFLAKKYRIKHVWHIREYGKEDHSLKPATGDLLFNLFLKSSDSTIFISHGLRKKFFTNRKGNSTVVYNGIANKKEIELNVAKRELYRKKNDRKPFTFAIVGTLSPSKGQHVAIEAFNSFLDKNNFGRLLIAGKGREEYQNKIEELIKGNNNIEYEGFLKDVEQVYLQTDVLLMCSKSEAFGRVTIEAMSYGIPVVGYNNAGTAEILNHRKNGLLYNDLIQLENNMELLYHNKHLYEKISAGSVRSVVHNFSLDSYITGVWNAMNNK